MTIVKEYLENFLTTKDNKLQTPHIKKCMFKVLSIARFRSNFTTADKKSRELKTIPFVSFSIAPSFHVLYCSPVAINLDVKNLPFLCKVHQLIFNFT